MTPFRYSIQVHGASHAHNTAHGTGHLHEQVIQPEERFVHGNGPVRILVENGKRLKKPKVIR